MPDHANRDAPARPSIAFVASKSRDFIIRSLSLLTRMGDIVYIILRALHGYT